MREIHRREQLYGQRHRRAKLEAEETGEEANKHEGTEEQEQVTEEVDPYQLKKIQYAFKMTEEEEALELKKRNERQPKYREQIKVHD